MLSATMTTPADIDEQLPLDPHHKRIRDRALLTVGVVVSLLIFNTVGKVFSIPVMPGCSASLIQQPSSLLSFVLCAIAFVVCVLASTMITGVVHFEAGFYCATFGLAALSMRGGAMRATLTAAPGPGVFLALAMELLLLYGILFVGWVALMGMRERSMLRSEDERSGEEDLDAVPSQGALALATQVMLMLFLMTILCQTDQKKQVLAAVGISAFLATLGAHSIFPTRPSAWFWCGPLLIGVAGYILAYFGDGPWTIGEIYGYDPALARPLPLDYASAGPVGALLGYWMSRHWQQARQDDADASAVTV
jgi:hypothetical protein